MKKFIVVSIAFISFMPIYGQSKKVIKKDLQASIERQKDKLIDIVDVVIHDCTTTVVLVL